ncbi:hypothetical protein, partial [Alteripontixanthobacter muriae]|uniref:hypothetical protein n=1 Tax=Alteripontixanthobacter muriae TaxID=2705546 RepID=UPI0019D5FFD4
TEGAPQVPEHLAYEFVERVWIWFGHESASPGSDDVPRAFMPATIESDPILAVFVCLKRSRFCLNPLTVKKAVRRKLLLSHPFTNGS